MKKWVSWLKDGIRASAIFALQNIFFLLARDATSLAATGPFLVVAPHPDDESLGCGCFVARARRLGQRVRIVIVTDGRGAVVASPTTPDELAVLRRDEALKASAILGVGPEEVIFLNLPDGKAEKNTAVLEHGLRQQIESINPKLIISPYGVDEHEDHRACAAAIDRLREKRVITCPVFEYPIWFWLWGARDHLMRPERLRRLRRIKTKGFIDKKLKALQAHPSQIPHLVGADASKSYFRPLSFHAQYFNRCEIFFEK